MTGKQIIEAKARGWNQAAPARIGSYEKLLNYIAQGISNPNLTVKNLIEVIGYLEKQQELERERRLELHADILSLLVKDNLK